MSDCTGSIGGPKHVPQLLRAFCPELARTERVKIVILMDWLHGVGGFVGDVLRASNKRVETAERKYGMQSC